MGNLIPETDAMSVAVENAIDQLNIDLKSYREYQHMRDVINVTVKRADNDR